ncbi:lysophospholipid acyltransferase family protein [Herbiconiux liangxiaofengii]|uniref:lysophospholipid acyltransferase family protein n=1 Tax=Herbiconiux liangxiaofengii TaxID=3342795 RepID=UPI0035BAF7B3
MAAEPDSSTTGTSVTRAGSEKTPAFRVAAAAVVPLLSAIVKVDQRGTDHLPAEGSFVLCPNHYSNFDPVVVAWGVWKLQRAPRFLAKASLFRVPVVGWALRMIGQIPVERAAGSNRDNGPMSAAGQLVEHGQGVIVYPEGTLTRDPGMWPMRGKTGAVRLALEHGIPLIPSAHWGVQAILPRYSKKLSLFPRKTVRILYGPPVDLDDLRGHPLDQKTLQEATARVMTAITALLEDLRGEQAPAERWNPAAHNQSQFGRIADGRREAAE